MGSGFDYWVYWHFFTITVGFNSSHIEFLLNGVCLTNFSLPRILSLSLSLSLMLRPTDSRPVCVGIKHPSGAYDQIFITCVTVTVLFLWDALSDERTGLSFVCATGPCQRNLSRVLVAWDSRSYFTVSHLRLSFPSPPTTRRVTVEVFDPASTRVRLKFTNELRFTTATMSNR
jgi:hypothetical protein